MANVAFLASDGILTGFKNSPTKLFREKMPWVGFSHKLAVLAWRSMQSHVQMPAYVHINVGQQTCANHTCKQIPCDSYHAY